MTPKPLCLFHRNCLDGRAAAAVVGRYQPDCEFQPIQYGDQVPQVEGREVFLVDFGLDIARMRALKAQSRSLRWIDHHASQEAVRRQLGWGNLDTSTCAALLVWRELFPNREAPAILAYVEDKDLWRWRLENSRAVAAGLEAAFPGDRFEGLLDVDPMAMAELGRPILAQVQARVQADALHGVPVPDAYGQPGLRALAVPCNRHQNELGEMVCLPESAGGLGYDLAVLFYYKARNRAWVHSLRSPKVDCAVIAARFGGGGHPASACYIAPEPIVRVEPLSPASAAGAPGPAAPV